MLPLKTRDQAITSTKITLATQEMVEKSIATGLKIHNHVVKVTQISRAKVLGTPQCFKCFSFDHETDTCNQEKRCLHCSEHHLYKECPNKSKKPKCANCKGAHKSNSNRCTIKKKYLIVPVSKKDPELVIIKNPESTYREAAIPTSNPWFSKSNKSHEIEKENMMAPSQTQPPCSQVQSNSSYSDCFNMALKFINPFEAFVEIQKAFGLKVVEMPASLKNKLKPEFGGEPLITPSTSDNSTQPPEPATPSTSSPTQSSVQRHQINDMTSLKNAMETYPDVFETLLNETKRETRNKDKQANKTTKKKK